MKKKLDIIVAGLAIAGALSLILPSALAQETTTPPSTTHPTTTHPERHPAIRHAIQALETARKDLQAANHDFGGHRVEALAACDKAIEQLKLALNYDKK